MCELDLISAVALAMIFGASGFLGMRMYNDHQAKKKTREYIENGKRYKR